MYRRYINKFISLSTSFETKCDNKTVASCYASWRLPACLAHVGSSFISIHHSLSSSNHHFTPSLLALKLTTHCYNCLKNQDPVTEAMRVYRRHLANVCERSLHVDDAALCQISLSTSCNNLVRLSLNSFLLLELPSWTWIGLDLPLLKDFRFTDFVSFFLGYFSVYASVRWTKLLFQWYALSMIRRPMVWSSIAFL